MPHHPVRGKRREFGRSHLFGLCGLSGFTGQKGKIDETDQMPSVLS